MQLSVAMASTAILDRMQALVIDPDPEWLEQRRLMGGDRWDEVWEGVLHVVPTPTSVHQRFELDLAIALREPVRARGLVLCTQLAIYLGEKNYRTPDITILPESEIREIGCTTADIVIEVLSPRDESRKKLAFYAAHGISEVWLVEPVSRTTEVYVLRGDQYYVALPNRAGVVEAPRLGLELSVVEGPRLRLAWDGGAADV